MSQNLARRIYSTVIAVFLAFLLRASYCVVKAIAASGYKNRNVACSLCDLPCLDNVYVLISEYLYVPRVACICHKKHPVQRRHLLASFIPFLHALRPSHALLMYQTPEFEANVLIISGPLAAAITLWGMHSRRKHSSANAADETGTPTT